MAPTLLWSVATMTWPARDDCGFQLGLFEVDDG